MIASDLPDVGVIMEVSHSGYQLLTLVAILFEEIAQRPEELELRVRNSHPVTYSGLARVSASCSFVA
jgi:hypothetical protein